MIKTTEFREIGWGAYASARIEVSTDYSAGITSVSVDDDLVSQHASPVAAIEAALDEPTAEYIIDRL